MRAWTIYVIGVVALGLVYQLLKQNLNGAVLLFGAVAYLALLSFVARRYGRK